VTVVAGQTADKSMTVFVTASEPAPQGKPTETVPRTYRFREVTRLAAPTDDAPWWRFEVTGTFLWSAPAKPLSRLVEDFIAKNHDTLTTAAKR
jgi:hypothetical protein